MPPPSEIFPFIVAPTGIESRAQGKWPQTRSPCRQRAPTDKGPLYRQGAFTDKKLIQTRAPTDKGPYRLCLIPTDKGTL